MWVPGNQGLGWGGEPPPARGWGEQVLWPLWEVHCGAATGHNCVSCKSKTRFPAPGTRMHKVSGMMAVCPASLPCTHSTRDQGRHLSVCLCLSISQSNHILACMKGTHVSGRIIHGIIVPTVSNHDTMYTVHRYFSLKSLGHKRERSTQQSTAALREDVTPDPRTRPPSRTQGSSPIVFSGHSRRRCWDISRLTAPPLRTSSSSLFTLSLICGTGIPTNLP